MAYSRCHVRMTMPAPSWRPRRKRQKRIHARQADDPEPRHLPQAIYRSLEFIAEAYGLSDKYSCVDFTVA